MFSEVRCGAAVELLLLGATSAFGPPEFCLCTVLVEFLALSHLTDVTVSDFLQLFSILEDVSEMGTAAVELKVGAAHLSVVSLKEEVGILVAVTAL